MIRRLFLLFSLILLGRSSLWLGACLRSSGGPVSRAKRLSSPLRGSVRPSDVGPAASTYLGGLWIVLLALLALPLLAGCGGGGGISEVVSGQITLSLRGVPVPLSSIPNLVFNPGEVAPGEVSFADVRLQNVAPRGLLTVASISLVPSSATDFSLVEVPALPAALGEEESIRFRVRFTRPLGDQAIAPAAIVIASDTLEERDRELIIPLVAEATVPVLAVSPSLVDFDKVADDEVASREIRITNTGAAEAVITGLSFTGHPDFRLVTEFSDEASSLLPDDQRDPTLASPWRIAPQAHRLVRVLFAPLNPSPATAQIVLYANTAEGQHQVDVIGNANRPCIEVSPTVVQFGPKLVGQPAVLPIEVRSCGNRDLTVTGIAFEDNVTGNFELGFAALPNGAPSPEVPLLLPINGKVSLTVSYLPNAESLVDGDGLVPDEALIRVESDAWEPETFVPVTGFGTSTLCPIAVGSIAEGEQVIPQTKLHLTSAQSTAPGQSIAEWRWSVVQPPGSASVFQPAMTTPSATFEANVAGAYQFSLDVWSEDGVKSCVPWQATVLVVPDEAIHVELTWTTPNDPDETDEGVEAGTDLDLHFVHMKYAVTEPGGDPWFNMPFDAYWFNPNPNWGTLAPNVPDDPSLDRDDTDGAGPENLNLDQPQNGAVYGVGVHYWSDSGYGESFASVRIYIFGSLVFEAAGVPMSSCDLWDVARIEWPSGKVTLMQVASGGYATFPGYSNANFPCP